MAAITPSAILSPGQDSGETGYTQVDAAYGKAPIAQLNIDPGSGVTTMPDKRQWGCVKRRAFHFTGVSGAGGDTWAFAGASGGTAPVVLQVAWRGDTAADDMIARLISLPTITFATGAAANGILYVWFV